MGWRLVAVAVLAACTTVARTNARVIDGAQGQLTAQVYAIEVTDETVIGGQGQLDLGWGKQLANNTGVYAGVKVAVPWFATSLVDLYLQGPSSEHVSWGIGTEGGYYVAGGYACVTLAGDAGAYVTLTGRVHTPVTEAHPFYGAQLAIGLRTFLVFTGYMQDRDGYGMLLVGLGLS